MNSALTIGALIAQLQALEKRLGSDFPIGVENTCLAAGTIDSVRGIYEATWPGLVVISNEVQE